VARFIDPDLNAPNATVIPVDPGIVSEFEPLVTGPFPKGEYSVVRPRWQSDLQWISAQTPRSFGLFQSAFDRMNVAAHVADYLDLDDAPRLYAGFLLVRSRCTSTDFHVDWLETNNQAFTLITPLDQRIRGFGLVYRDVDGRVREYDYRPGEAILFGNEFIHSTKPGSSDRPVAMLCFQFGTDKMAYWDSIMRTAGYQSFFIQQPDGRYAVRKRHWIRRNRYRWVTC